MMKVVVPAFMSAVLVFVSFGCKKEKYADNSSVAESEFATKRPSSSPGGTCANYNVALSRSFENGQTSFVWTVTNPNPGNGTNGTLQNLSHWSFIPGCAGDLGLEQNWSDIISAQISFDGSTWTVIGPTPILTPDPSQSCSNANVFKFNYGTSGSNPSYYKLVIKGNYAEAEDNFAVFKSGANTGCCTRIVPGIGCKQDEYCSFSQGYYFAKPGPTWTELSGVITVGGFEYTEEEGRAIWDCSNAGGIKDSKKGFTQVSALKLSGAYPSGNLLIDADVVLIENWLASKGKLVACSNLPNQTENEKVTYGNAAAAAARIGEWINNNHCSE